MSSVLTALLLAADEDDLALMREKLGIAVTVERTRDSARLMTSVEAAEAASVSVETIRRHAEKGTLRAKRSGSRIRIHPDDLDEWLDSEHGRRSKPQRSRPRASAGGRSTMHDALAQLQHREQPAPRDHDPRRTG